MTVKILRGDCREILATLPDESVHCVVTSPPYWGLRDYGVEGQIGLEASFADYIETMRAVFAEVRRVLRADGTLWLNMGDSYASSVNGRKAEDIVNDDRTFRDKPFSTVVAGLFKPKDLCGIPWRVAFALQADGWYLRSEIIWSKPNPMPESVTDRPTKAHEQIFLMSKNERYYYDAEAIKTPSLNPGQICAMANRRTVWEIATAPFSEAHFASYPPALIEPCILAGCPKQCCAKCGAPWVREVERSRSYDHVTTDEGKSKIGPYANQTGNGAGTHDIRHGVYSTSKTLGFSPSCHCNVGTVPGTVLDPFGGAGTTGLVADRLGRNAILIELNPEYADMANRRLHNDAGMFAEVS